MSDTNKLPWDLYPKHGKVARFGQGRAVTVGFATSTTRVCGGVGVSVGAVAAEAVSRAPTALSG